MGRGERLFSFFDEFFSLLISNNNRVGVLSGDSVDELAHLFKRGGSALQCGFHRIIYISSIHFYKIQKFLQIGSKIEAENSAWITDAKFGFLGAGRLDFRDNILDNCYFFAFLGHFWGVFLCFCKKSGLCDDGRIAWWYGIEQKVGFAFACMELSTIRHLRRHFRFGFGGLRRRERGDGGVGLLLAVLGGSDGVHLFEKAREVGAVVETALHGNFANL